MDTITLQPGQHVDVVIDGHTVRLTHQTDTDGHAFVVLGGIGCDLEGEQPGVYYPTPRTED